MITTHSMIKGISWAIAASSAVLTGIFGASFGVGSWFLTALFFFVFVLISILCPILVNATASNLLRKSFARAVILLPFAAFFVFADLLTNGGTAALFRQAELVNADNQNTKARDARNDVNRLEKEIASIQQTVAWKGIFVGESGTEYPLTDPAAFDQIIATQEKLVAQEAARVRCGPECEKRQRKLKELQAARANAVERAAQKKQMQTLRDELKDAKIRSAETPTLASAAIAHSTNLAAGITGQIAPDEKAKFWANYGLSLLSGVAVTLANMAACILLAFSAAASSWSGRRDDDSPWVQQRQIVDHRPSAQEEAAAGQTIILQNKHDHTDDTLAVLSEAVSRINARYAV